MSVEKYLRESGLPEDRIQQVLEGIEREFGRVGLRTLSENILTNVSTGKLRVTRPAEAGYRRLFALAGMNMNDYLGDKRAFLQAFRIANSAKFARLNPEGIGFPNIDR